MTEQIAAISPIAPAPITGGDAPLAKKSKTVRQRAIRGAMWTTIGFGTSQILRFGSNLILTRLLVPQIFGVMTLVNVFITGVQMFSDVGIRGSILRHQNKHIEPDFLDTAWTLQAVRGCFMAIVASALAWPFAIIYHEPQLIPLIVVSSLTLVISGFNSTALFVQDRKMYLGRSTMYSLVSQLASLVVMVVCSYFYRSAWPLVWGTLVFYLMVMISSYWLIPHKHRLIWNNEAGKELLAFGAMVFISSSALFLANTSERFILGKFISLSLLGVYSIGQGLSTTITQVITRLCDKVLYPTYAELLRERPKQAMNRYSQSRWLLFAMGLIVAVMGGVFGQKIVHGLYDHRYWEAGWMLQIFALEAFCEIVQLPAGYLLKAANKPGYMAIANVCRAFVQIIALIVALKFFGLREGIWMISASAGFCSVVLALGVAIAYPKLWKMEVLLSFMICATILGEAWLLG